MHAAADYFGVPFDGLFSPTREGQICLARYAIMYVMREREGQSTPQIGRRLQRDHSTVVHGMKRARDLLARDPDFAAFVNAQLRLPRYSPAAAILHSPYKPWEAKPEPAPKVAVWKAPAVVKFAPVARPKPEWEEIWLDGDHRMRLDQHGYTLDENMTRDRIITGSRKLAAAIQQARAA